MTRYEVIFENGNKEFREGTEPCPCGSGSTLDKCCARGEPDNELIEVTRPHPNWDGEPP